MPQLSIVVPYRGDTKLFEQTLVSVLQNRPVDCEVIVPHFNYQDPYELCGEVEFVEVNRKANISRQLDVALQVSKSEVIHWLSPGVEVTEGWCGWSVAHFQDPHIGSVVPLIVDEDSKVLSAGLKPDLFLRKRNVGSGKDPQELKMLSPCGPSSSAGFYRKSALQQIGGVSNFGAATLDLDIAMALGEIGFDCKLEVDCLIKLEEGQLESFGSIRTGIDMQNTVWRFTAADSLFQSLLIFTGASLFELSTAIFRPEHILRIFGRIVALKDMVGGSRFHRLLETTAGPERTVGKRPIIQLEQQGTAIDDQSAESVRRAA